LLKYLGGKGISCGIHYPIPIHRQLAYKSLGYRKGGFPVSEKLSRQILSLPMYPELSEEEIKYISLQIRSFFE